MTKIRIVSDAACADIDRFRCSHQARDDVMPGVPRLNPMFGLDEMTLLCQLPLQP